MKTPNERGCQVEAFDELFSIWRDKEPWDGINHNNKFIKDGIVNPEVWYGGQKKKILFILKEARCGEGDPNAYDLAEWLRADHPRKRIWSRIARLVYGIERTNSSHICRYNPKLDDTEHSEAIEQIAVINLKKSDGKSESDYDEIQKYAQYDSIELLREFELIDPDIIICGSTFKTFAKEVLTRTIEQEEKCDNWYYWIDVFGKIRLFIDFYHPSNHWPDLYNYYALMAIYQQALLEKSECK